MSKKKKREAWGLDNGFEEWGGYMAAKKLKLAEQFQEEAAKEFENSSNLFQGICIFVNGYTNPTADELKRLMMEYGGMYHYYMRPKTTTHIIASNLPYSKIMMHKKSQNPVPICKPEWITDSIKAGKVLDYQNYLLYSNYTKTQPQLKFATKNTGDSSKAAEGFSGKKKTDEYFAVPGSSSLFEENSKDSSISDQSKKVQTENRSKDSHKIPEASLKDSSVFDKPEKDSAVTEQSSKSPEENMSMSKNALSPEDPSEGSLGNSPLPDEHSTVFDVPKQESAVTQQSLKSLGESTPTSRTALSTNNPDFLSEFYSNSRLHHISTMGTMFKDYINELREKSDGSFPGLERLKRSGAHLAPCPDSDSDDETLDDQDVASSETGKKTVVMHIDMDCFFVSVGLRNRPELRGLPVAVTHAKGNRRANSASCKDAESSRTADDRDEKRSMSEVASCSYEARKAGVKNGMFLGQALQLCPDLKTIKYDFEGYNKVSYALYDTVASYTLSIEAVSCDEMYADCTALLAETRLTPMQFAEVIRKEIKEKTGCPVSTGFGQNKLQARLATRRAKPDGQFHLRSDNVQKYLGCFIVRDLPGVGYTTMRKLNGMGVHTCAELQSVSVATLQREFGRKTGEMLYNISRGIDNSKLSLEHVRKSVSAEVNYGIRFKSSGDAEDFLRKLSAEVCNRLNKANMRGRCVTLKLMVRAKDAPQEAIKFMGHGICDHLTRSKNLISSVNDLSIIFKEVLALWNQLQQALVDVRGVGIQISRLESTKSKSEKNNMMSFISKGKLRGAEQIFDSGKTEVIGRSDVKTSKSSNAKGLSAFLIPKITSSTDKNEQPKSTLSKNNESMNRTETFQKDVVSASPSKIDRHAPSHNDNSHLAEKINEKILTELPEDIRMKFISSEKESGDNSSKAIEMSAEENDNTEKYHSETSPDVADTATIHNSQSASTSKENGKFSNVVNGAKNEVSTQDIDESVLAELPEDIRNEIILTREAKQKSSFKNKNEPVAKIQTKQESYFKQAKPRSEKLNKVKMPAVQEIDMSVLVELPEDIRNEILNEYRAERRTARENSASVDEINVSFSQVDPDFLAALPEEFKNDVKDYCAKKKLEKVSREKNEAEQKAQPSSRVENVPNKLPLHQKTTRQNKTKSTVRKYTKTAKNHKKSAAQRPPQREMSSDDKRQNVNTDGNNDQEQNKSEQEVVTARDSIHKNKPTVIHGLDEHEEMLNRLVDQFLSLPIRQIKLQLQTWISESDSVNEVDFLSLAIFLSTLPRKKRIEDLHVLLKTMHRCINKTGNCAWHQMYRKTVEHVQRHMQVEYESNLMLPPFECELLQCRNTLTR